MAGDYMYMVNNPGVDIYGNDRYNGTPIGTPSRKEQIIAKHKENLANNNEILDDDKNLANNNEILDNNENLDNNNQNLDNNNENLDNNQNQIQANNQNQIQPSQDIAFETTSNPSVDKETLLKNFLNQAIHKAVSNSEPIEVIKQDLKDNGSYFKITVDPSIIKGYIQTINSTAKRRYLDSVTYEMCGSISMMFDLLNEIISTGTKRLGKSFFSSSKDAHTNNTMAAKELLAYYTLVLKTIGMDKNGEATSENSLYKRYKNYVTQAVVGNNDNRLGYFDYKIRERIYRNLDFVNAVLRLIFDLPFLCENKKSNGGRKSRKSHNKGKSRKSSKKGKSRKSRKSKRRRL